MPNFSEDAASRLSSSDGLGRAWGAAAGISVGALLGWYLAEIQSRQLDCATHPCEGVGLLVPVGMFFGFWAGIVAGVLAAVTFAIWSGRRSRRSVP